MTLFFQKLKNNALVSKIWESFLSVIPITISVSILYFVGLITDTSIGVFDLNAYLFFLLCSLIAIIGLGLFQLGVDKSMTRMGALVGETLARKKNMFLLVIMTFILGFLVTMAEPDLTVLANSVGLSNYLVIGSVSAGTALFLVIGVIRVLKKQSLKIMFLAFYALVFALVGIVNPSFLPLCFDSGGVSSGPVTVPFILAFGAGVAMSTNGKASGEDSFGFSALCSVGPILAVMVLALFMPEDALSPYEMAQADFTFGHLGNELVECLYDVALAFGPLIVIFLIYNFFFLKLPWKSLLKILVGLVYGFVGLWLFLTAVNGGFFPTASIVGLSLVSRDLWIAVTVAGLFGLFAVLAEPAVHVLVKQIEKISDGAIKKWTVMVVLAIGNMAALIMAILRAYYVIEITYFVVAGYILIFMVMLFSPNIYTYIAFDSGAVASGPMASAFLLPFVIGFAYGFGLDINLYGFGVVGFIAMMPLLGVQLLGAYGNAKSKLLLRRVQKTIVEPDDDQIIHFSEAL